MLTISRRSVFVERPRKQSVERFEEKQYRDIWSNDDYLQFMYERLILIRELLSEDGSIFVHVGVDVSHHVRCLLEEVFGKQRFVNEIVWRKSFAHNDPNKCGNIHDSIYYFSKAQSRTWNQIFQKPSQDYINEFFDQYDEDRKERYTRVPLDAPRHGDGGNMVYEWKGAKPSPGRTWATTRDKMQKSRMEGRIHYPEKGMPRLKRFESEYQGTVIQDLWIDINKLHNRAPEATSYPTQKPEKLIERIVLAASLPDDLVLDAFMGSGTALAVAAKLGRRFLGCDINLGAIQTTTKRLIQIASHIRDSGGKVRLEFTVREADNTAEDGELGAGKATIKTRDFEAYTGFRVHNVNDYDIFRNPVQAKELLLEALEVTPLGVGRIFDGEKDGFLVKIMEPNRIASREDLNDVITALDLSLREKAETESDKTG